jgi:hypothetical protein
MPNDDGRPDRLQDWYYRPDDFVAEGISDDGHYVEHSDGPLNTRAQQADAGLSFEMSGRPPRKEDGTDHVCIRLAQALERSTGLIWSAEPLAPSAPETGVDGFVVGGDGQRIGVQVTRVGQEARWAETGRHGTASGFTTIEQAATDIWRAIGGKLLAQDPTVILALHGGEPGYYGFLNVVQAFERLYGTELRRKIVFGQVWLIGYTERTTARLHPK